MGCASDKSQAPPQSQAEDNKAKDIVTTKSPDSAPTQESIVVNYFNLYARGEQIRVLLRFLKIEFQDNRIEFA
jgi:hypothetical protein